MATPRPFVTAVWPARIDALDECADRIRLTLEKLGRLTPTLAAWFEPGRSARDARSRPVELGTKAIASLVLRSRADSNGDVVSAELGYTVRFWNGESGDDGATIQFRVGHGSPYLLNSVTVKTPRSTHETWTVRDYARVVECLAVVWEPRWAALLDDADVLAPSYDPRTPPAAQAIYVHADEPDPVVPEEARPVGQGRIILVEPDRVPRLPSSDPPPIRDYRSER